MKVKNIELTVVNKVGVTRYTIYTCPKCKVEFECHPGIQPATTRFLCQCGQELHIIKKNYQGSNIIKRKNREKLVQAQDEYIDFLSSYISKFRTFLFVHGFIDDDKDISKGEELREKIKKAKEELNK